MKDMQDDTTAADPNEAALKGLIEEMYELVCRGQGDQEMEPGAIADAAQAGATDEADDDSDTAVAEPVDMAEETPAAPAPAKANPFGDDVKNFMKFGGKPKPSTPGTRVTIALAGGAPKAELPKPKKKRGARGG